jgi:iron-sulfur cluster assembly protein
MPLSKLPLLVGVLAGLAACERQAPTREPAPPPAKQAPAPPPDAAPAPIRLTARATAMIEQVRRDEGVELPLRIEVRLGGPPPGVEYLLYFDEPRPTDQRFEVDGVSLIVDRDSVQHVAGTEVDFLETSRGAGFKLNNPNEDRLITPQ